MDGCSTVHKFKQRHVVDFLDFLDGPVIPDFRVNAIHGRRGCSGGIATCATQGRGLEYTGGGTSKGRSKHDDVNVLMVCLYEGGVRRLETRIATLRIEVKYVF